jgi:hypothetical protein
MVIKAFYKNYKIHVVQRRVLKKILSCSAGKTAQYFLEWKNLPDVDAKNRRGKMSIFEKGLDKYYQTKLKFTFESFKNYIYEGDSRKKHAVRKLVLATMSDSNRLFSKWKQLNTEANILKRSDLIQNLFLRLVDTVRTNLGKIAHLKGPDSKALAIRKLMDNNDAILCQGFDIWRTWSTNIKQNIRREALNRVCYIL